jgi:hydrogenase maturation protein HypF
VQGLGFRPFVYRLASELSLAGWVGNSPQGVLIEVEGPPGILDEFLRRLDQEKPPHAFFQNLEPLFLDPAGYCGFEIRESNGTGTRTAVLLPDIATCPKCLSEIFNSQDRRHLYPFTNCTHCGPRFSIIEALPYDRANTSMQRFEMCPACQCEYREPSNRRFHAQPNACPECGPHLEEWDARGRRRTVYHEALLSAADTIRKGEIVAVKGVGGFHLMVDARNEEAVRRLRRLKHREEKPFALLYPSIGCAERDAEISREERRVLLTAEAPIVILPRASEGVAPSVAPRNPNVGIMLPSNPLHHLLMRELGTPVAATSGNLSEEPICIDEHEALERSTILLSDLY